MNVEPHVPSTVTQVAPELAVQRPGALSHQSVRQLLSTPFRLTRAVTPAARYALVRAGRTGTVGLALLMVAAGLIASTLLPLRRHVGELQQQVQHASVDSPLPSAIPAPGEDLKVFMRALPRRGELPSVVATVIQQAQETRLELVTGRYELVSGQSHRRMGQYRLIFPVKGTYPDLRSFIERALLAAPALALESLRMQRDDISQDVVTAEVAFVIYVRGEP